MSEESTVLIVDAQHLPGALEAQLQSREVFAEHASAADISQVAPVLFPDLVVLSGKADVESIIATLSAMRPPLPAVVVADRAAIRLLRESAVSAAALIPQDLPAAAIAHRIATMAKKSAQGEPMARPVSIKPKATPERGSLAPAPAAPAVPVLIKDAEEEEEKESYRRAEERRLALEAEKNQKAEERRLAEERKRNEAEEKRKEAEERRKQELRDKHEAAEKKRADLARKQKESEEKRAALEEKRRLEQEARAEERRRAAEVRRSVAPPRASVAPRASTPPPREAAKQAKSPVAEARADGPHREASSLFSRQALERPEERKSPLPQKTRQKDGPNPSQQVEARPTKAAQQRTQNERDRPVSDNAPPRDDELSVVAALPVDLRLPLSTAKVQLPSLRLAYLDTDVTRADAVAGALRRRGMEVFPLTPDPAQTRWPLLRRFAPQGLIVDEKGMVRRDAAWVETFRGDPFLRHVPLIVFRLSRLFHNAEGSVDLEPLLNLIEPLGKEEASLLDKLQPGRQVDLNISQIAPLRLVQMLTEQDRNTRLDCRGSGQRIVWPLGPGYAGKAKLLEVGSDKVVAKLSPEEALTWLLQHDDCDVSVHEHSEPLAHASESKDAARLLHDMTDAIGVPSRHESVFPAAISSAHPMAALVVPQSASPYLSQAGAETLRAEALPSFTPSSADDVESDSSALLESDELSEDEETRKLSTNEGNAAEKRSGGETMNSPPMTPMDSVRALKPPSKSEQITERALSMLTSGVASARTAWTRYDSSLQPLREKVPPAVGPYLAFVPVLLLFVICVLVLLPSTPSTETVVAQQASTEKKASETKEPKSTTAPEPEKAATISPPEVEPIQKDRWKISEDTHLPSCEDNLGPATPKSESPARAAGYWKQARNLLMVGKTGEAVEMMCLAGLYDPAGPAAEGLTEYYLGKRSLKEAERWVRTSLKADPDRRKSQELLGDVENQKGNVDESRKIWLDTMLLKGDETAKLAAIARKLMEDGRRAIKGGDLPRAERELRRAATLAPENAQVAATLAKVLLERNMPQAASDWAAYARETDPNDSSVLLLSGEIAEAQKKFDQARTFYQSVPPGDPFHGQAQNRIGRLP